MFVMHLIAAVAGNTAPDRSTMNRGRAASAYHAMSLQNPRPEADRDRMSRIV